MRHQGALGLPREKLAYAKVKPGSGEQFRLPYVPIQRDGPAAASSGYTAQTLFSAQTKLVRCESLLAEA